MEITKFKRTLVSAVFSLGLGSSLALATASEKQLQQTIYFGGDIITVEGESVARIKASIAEQGFPTSNFDMEYNLLKSEMDKNPPYAVYNVLTGTQLYGMQGSNDIAVAGVVFRGNPDIQEPW